MICIEEIWKDIEGYEGYYQVSNMGRVKSLSRPIYTIETHKMYRISKEKIKCFKIDKDGYRTVTLSIDGNDKTFKVHRLVAQAFIPNPNNLPEVNHIDLDRSNNFVNNLEWCIHSDNIKHSQDAGKYIIGNTGTNNGRSKTVNVFDNKHRYLKTFNSIKETAIWLKENYFLNGSIRSISGYIAKCIKIGKLYRNLIFEFKD